MKKQKISLLRKSSAVLCASALTLGLLVGCGASSDASAPRGDSAAPEYAGAPAASTQEKSTKSVVYTQPEITSLEDYARSLEENGLAEAAAAVYALIPGYHGELSQRAHSEDPEIGMSDEFADLNVIFSHVGGDAK